MVESGTWTLPSGHVGELQRRSLPRSRSILLCTPTPSDATQRESATQRELCVSQWAEPGFPETLGRADSPLELARDAKEVCEIQPVISHPASSAGRVLMVYTGGTLGMVKHHDGTLVPPQRRGMLCLLIQSMPEFHDETLPDLDMIEYFPLIDSSNIGPQDWAALAQSLQEHYYDYDGFVIIHGTDTMAYTASALSFMLEGLGKPVILTGSMIPLCEPLNDARRNLIASLMFASQLELCEVAIFFNDRLLRGNRAVKCDATGLAAFDTPNFEALATIGASGAFVATQRDSWQPQPACRLRVHTHMSARVVVVRLSPGFDDEAISAMIQHTDNLDGLVLSMYGTGNGPTHKSSFVDLIKKAISRNILVVATTQCHKGTVALNVYEVGKRLLSVGVVSAGDMTTEACVAKISYLCGRGLQGETLRSAMAQDLRGELTQNLQRRYTHRVGPVYRDQRL